MSSKRKLLNVMLVALSLLGVNSHQVEAASYGKNGVAYVLLNEDFSPASGAGVYRFNNAAGDVCSPFKVFNNLKTAQGLAADQSLNTKLYLMKPSGVTGDWKNASVGYLPTGITFDPDADIYLRVALPSELNNYDYPASAHGWGSYFRKNMKIDGVTYSRAVRFGGPTGVMYLNSTSGTRGTPLWNGTGHIAHPTDKHLIILPSHYCAVSYYLIGTSNSSYAGEYMDGKDGRDEITYDKANNMGAYNSDITAHNNNNRKWGWSRVSTNKPADGHRCDADQFIGAVVKRVYQLRDKTLDMYEGTDTTNSLGRAMSPTNMTEETKGVLATNDVRVKEFYGKTCGDDCIPGNPMPDKEAAGFLSTINVLSTTTGKRYGYNREGNPAGGGSSAALRVIEKKGTNFVTTDIRIDGSNKNTNISNGSKFSSYTDIKNIGVSSKFSEIPTELDFIYGSSADKFVVQDSWWGQGGIAYEYDQTTKDVTKYDYTKNNNAAGQVVGKLTGSVDAIGIDGDAYLYALKTVVEPSDGTMQKADTSIGTDWPFTTSWYNGTCTVGGKTLPIRVSCWKRTTINDEGKKVTSDVTSASDIQPDDYREVIIKQNVKKELERYPDATNQMGTAEYRGEIFVGYDSWSNRLYRYSGRGAKGTNYWQNSKFESDLGAGKVSGIQAELAVVNIADHPTYIPGTTNHYLAAWKTDGSTCRSGVDIGEHGELTFKVEGYKPNGLTFKNVGDFKANGSKLTSVKINSIQNAAGQHSFNENNDTYYSGYPSTMFEASGINTEVYWNIWQVENTSAEDYKSHPKRVKQVLKDQKVTSAEQTECKYTHKFLDPGRYVVTARIKYNAFTYSSFVNAERPEQLVPTTEEVTTEPMLVQVVAGDLNLDQSPSYITDITITKNNRINDGKPENSGLNLDSYAHSKGYSGVISGKSESDFDTLEGNENTNGGNFGELTVSFNAQFFWEESDGTSDNFKTHDGIGVWDYTYYKELYQKAGFDDPDNSKLPTVTKHIYNYNTAGTNLAEIYKNSVYNPGKKKAGEGDPGVYGTYLGGTRVSKKNPDDTVDFVLTPDDLKYIQWGLYLRKISPQEIDLPKDQLVAKGVCIASGNLAESGVDLNHKKNANPGLYEVSINIPLIKNTELNIPRDLGEYIIDFEIVYPRVTWLNNALGMSDSRKFFSSIVPTGANTSPIHVLSNMRASGEGVNQTKYSTKNDIFSDPPSITLCVRDTVIRDEKNKGTAYPAHEDNSKMDYYETTGDNVVGEAYFDYYISDNNPFMQFSRVSKKANLVPLNNSNATSVQNAKKGISLYLERFKDATKFNSEIVFEEQNKKPTDAKQKKVDIKLSDTSNEFFKNNDWNIKVTYTEKVDKLSPFDSPNAAVAGKVPGYEFDTLKETALTTKENWIGTLNYTIASCTIFDGLGANGKSTVHWLYSEAAVNSKKGIENGGGYPSFPGGSYDLVNQGVYKPYLTRIDNDPPSIKVDLVSQSDNIRYEYQLIEGVNDAARCPNKAEDLAPSRLIVKSYELLNNTANNSTLIADKKDIPGVTNVYGGDHPTTHETALGGDPLVVVSNAAEFRATARLIINVDILDNTGFRNLKDAKITVNDRVVGSLLDSKINTEKTHDETGSLIGKFQKSPRGVFSVELPSVVDGNNQITVIVEAEDLNGNKRGIQIPVNLRESAFEARVIETKEHKK